MAQAPSCTSAGPQGVVTYATSGTLDFYAYGVQNANTVYFPTWSDVNGQDDIVWYQGVSQGGGTWKGTVNLANHRPGNPDYGLIYVHVWMVGSETVFCGSANFTRVASQAPQAVSVTPSSGSGSSQSFTFLYSDPNGYADLASVYGRFNASASDAAACSFRYDRASNQLRLYNDAGTAWLGPVTLGTQIGNSQCTITSGSATPSGNNLTLNLTISFNSSFAGAKNVYMQAVDAGGASSGWQTKGAWTVPTGGTAQIAIYGTGVVSAGVPAADGAVDAHYALTSSADPAYPGPNALVINSNEWLMAPIGPWVANDSNSKWIGPRRDAGSSPYNAPGTYTYRTTFDLTGFNPATAVLTGRWATDNSGSIRLNGATAGTSSNTFDAFTLFTINTGFVSGVNTLEFVLDNWTTSPSPTGLRVEISGTAVPTGNQPPQAVSVTPSSGSGLGPQTFQFAYSDPNGYTDLASVYGRFNASASDAAACSFRYDRASNQLRLYNDAGTAWLGPVVLGNQLGNSQCTLSAGSTTPSGNNLTVNLTITFSSSFAGAKNVYMQAVDAGGASSGWQQKGTWSVSTGNQAPQAVSVTPSSGNGPGPQQFQFAYSDPNGYADLASLYGRFNATASDAAACSFRYDRASNYLYLWNEAGSAWLAPVLLSSQIGNSQCTLAGGSASPSGNNLTLSLTITFAASFAGGKNVYMQAVDASSASSGWQTKGTWTVSGAQANPAAPVVPVSAGGKGPPAAGASGCATPNCVWMDSSITYISPAQAYGLSTTFTTGPDMLVFTNLALAKMFADGQDLGSACANYVISLADNSAAARVPCSSPTNFYLYAPKLYTLTGFHQWQVGSVNSGVWQTYDSLGFVAAGTSRDFNGLPMGPFSNFQTASGPTILPSNDGVTVEYTARTVNTVSVRINAPYSAGKGRHQLSFPATNIYGYPAGNPYFAIIVYDATPAIASVTPNPIPAGAATTLTITGTGFGDHPTVYVAGTAYNPGAPSRNPQGQDVVSFSVTLPLGQAGSPVSVYLVSNGAGGQAFFGAPQGAAQGSATSNTMQVQVAAPPTISGNQGIWWLGSAPVNDNCDPGSPVPNCYYNSTQLTLTPGAGGTPPTASSPASWSVTPSSFVRYDCVAADCRQVVLTATSQPPGCGTLSVAATLGGISSATFTVVVNWPSYVLRDDSDIRTTDYGLPGPPPGYLSHNTLRLISACGFPMFNIALHEEFPAAPTACSGSVNWTDPIPQANWGSWITDADGKFVDTVGYACADCTPPSNTPGPLRGQPLSTQANASAALFIFVGSQDTVSLGKHFAAQPNKQVRYADHGRDQPGTWTCPGP